MNNGNGNNIMNLTAYTPEVKTPGMWGRVVLVILIAILIIYVVHENTNWYCSLCKPSWNLAPGWMIFLWIVFIILFVWAWGRSGHRQCNSRWKSWLWAAILVLLLAWVIDLFWVHDICAARWIILAATVLMVIVAGMAWRYCRIVAGVSVLLAIWLIYVTAVTWNYSEDFQEGSSNSNHSSI